MQSVESSNPLIGALDAMSTTSKFLESQYQYGENNHVEYSKVDVSKLQERILQFQFQLVRTTSDSLIKIEDETREILNTIFTGIRNAKCEEDKSGFVSMGVIMFKLLAYTRDIIAGKGEYMLFYAMLLEWTRIDIRFFEFVIKSLVYENGDDSGDGGDGSHYNIENKTQNKKTSHPLGSWKDMKYFLTFLKQRLIDHGSNDENSKSLYNSCVDIVVRLINEQLRIDKTTLCDSSDYTCGSFSLVAKWVPREKSKKFGWLYYYLATDFLKHQIPSDNTHPSYERAVNRAFMVYRKLLSDINKRIDTTQVKQCSKQWSQIDFNNVTSITMSKQTKSFLNVKNDGKTVRCSDDEDRDICSHNYQAYLKSVTSGSKKIKGAHVSMIDFVKNAIASNAQELPSDSPIVTTINEQWKDNSSRNGKLAEFIAMCDVSGSMTDNNCNPLFSAIGLSIRVAEKSALGQRVMTFAERPAWIQLDTTDSDTFVKKVAKLRSSSWGMTTDFYVALDLIRQGIEDNKLPREVAEKMVLIIFSDMQINEASSEMQDLSKKATLFENIKQMFTKMGERMYGAPINPPHIVFWNLKNTTGYPALSTDKNVSMMSGFSPVLLNVFCEKGVEGLKEYTPWLTFLHALNNDRYSVFEKIFKSII
jgi:hypothetical protein